MARASRNMQAAACSRTQAVRCPGRKRLCRTHFRAASACPSYCCIRTPSPAGTLAQQKQLRHLLIFVIRRTSSWASRSAARLCIRQPSPADPSEFRVHQGRNRDCRADAPFWAHVATNVLHKYGSGGSGAQASPVQDHPRLLLFLAEPLLQSQGCSSVSSLCLQAVHIYCLRVVGCGRLEGPELESGP